jgi:hypothetical protein
MCLEINLTSRTVKMRVEFRQNKINVKPSNVKCVSSKVDRTLCFPCGVVLKHMSLGNGIQNGLQDAYIYNSY